MSERFLAFQFASRLWGVPMVQARELIPFPVLTPVPHAPDWLLGSCQLRGDLLSVISPHPFFNCPSPEAITKTQLLILDDTGWAVGIPVNTAFSFEAKQDEWSPSPLASSFPSVESELHLEARPLALINLAKLRDQVLNSLRYQKTDNTSRPPQAA